MAEGERGTLLCAALFLGERARANGAELGGACEMGVGESGRLVSVVHGCESMGFGRAFLNGVLGGF